MKSLRCPFIVLRKIGLRRQNRKQVSEIRKWHKETCEFFDKVQFFNMLGSSLCPEKAWPFLFTLVTEFTETLTGLALKTFFRPKNGSSADFLGGPES